ncbi:MAG: cytochrome P450, partial [Novosphingobium sp.]
MATLADRPVNTVDVSADALYVEDTWREPFAKLRAEMPLSYCPESPFGPYWSAVTHDLVAEVELRHDVFSSRWDMGNITIAEAVNGEGFPNFIAQDQPIHTAQRRVIAPAFSPSQMMKLDKAVKARTRELMDGLPIGETFDWVERVSI